METVIVKNSLRPRSKGYWKVLPNQREFFERVAKELHIKHPDEWSRLKVADVIAKGGIGVLAHYGGSLFKALRTVYPEHNWNEKDFRTLAVPKGYWKDLQNQREFIQKLGVELGIASPEDWYRVRWSDVRARGGAGLLNRYGNSMVKALSAVYPEFEWKPWRFSKPQQLLTRKLMFREEFIRSLEDGSFGNKIWFSKYFTSLGSATSRRDHVGNLLSHFDQLGTKIAGAKIQTSKRQLQLFNILEKEFSGHKIQMNFKEKSLGYSKNHPIELDIFIPSLSLAFEYQGEQHYHSVVVYGSLLRRKELDVAKKQICKTIGISLLEIPYWWDGTKESLLATIHRQRPDSVEPTSAASIPTTVPKARILPASLRTLNPTTLTTDVAQSWVYGALQGIRAVWKENGELILEQGSRIQLPYVLANKMPKMSLELYICGVNSTDELLAKPLDSLEAWKELFLYIVDAPLSDVPYEERWSMIKSAISTDHFIKLAIPIYLENSCRSEDLLRIFASNGMNGYFVQSTKSFYYTPNSCCHVKGHTHTHAVVKGSTRSQLLCKLPNQSVFLCPSSFAASVGSVVIIERPASTRGLIALRTAGLTWKQICEQQIPYSLAYGKTSKPLCRGCFVSIDKDQLRIQTTILHSAPKAPPQPMRVNFCANLDCIHKGLLYYKRQGSQTAPFDGLIFVQPTVSPSVVPNLAEVQWVYSNE